MTKKITLKVLLFALIISITSNFAKSQTYWQGFNCAGGQLGNDTVSAICINNSNNVWVGTNKGFSKYNGNQWTKYTTLNGLVNNEILSIAVETNGVAWIATDGGVSRFDGVNWQNFTTSNGLADNRVYCIMIDHNNKKWFGTNSGVSVYNDTTWSTFDQNNSSLPGATDIIAIAEDKSNIKWFGTVPFESGLYAYNDTTSQWQTYNSAIDTTICGDDYNDIFVDDSNNIWFSTWYGGYMKLDAARQHFKCYNTSNTNGGLPDNWINSFAKDDSSNLWIATDYGLSEYELTSNTWKLYCHNNVPIMTNSRVLKVAVDNNGNKWVGTCGGGIYEFLLSPVNISNTEIENNYIIYPNPFNENINIDLLLNENAHALISIFNSQGAKVYEAYQDYINNVTNRISVNTSNYSEGLYIVRIRTSDKIISKMITLVK
jgi:ligand-binding sensor domain-containing protein